MSGFYDIPGGPDLPTPGSPAAGGGSAVWGDITGSIPDQTDLETRLNAIEAASNAVPLDGSLQMTGELQLVVEPAEDAANSSLFFDEDNENRPTWKNSTGEVFDLTQGSTATIPGP